MKDSFTMKYLISLGGRNLYFLHLFRECVREIVRKCEKDNVIAKEWETKGGERDKKTKKAILERQYQNIVINCLKRSELIFWIKISTAYWRQKKSYLWSQEWLSHIGHR